LQEFFQTFNGFLNWSLKLLMVFLIGHGGGEAQGKWQFNRAEGQQFAK